MFQIIFLGTSAAIPSPERNVSGIAVKKDGSVYLFDCGEGTQRQMMRFGASYEKVEAIFLTHLHLDHVLGVFGLLETRKLKGRTEKVKVFGPPGTSAMLSRLENAEISEIRGPGKIFSGKDFSVHAFPSNHGLRHSFAYAFRENERLKFNGEKAHKLGLQGPMFKEIQEKGKLKVGKKTIKLSDIAHPIQGKCMVYTGDTKPIKDYPKEAKAPDAMIHEATYGKDRQEEAHERNHSSSEDAAKEAKRLKAKLLVLTHISSRYPDAKVLENEARKIFKNSKVAYDGLDLTL